MCSSLPACPPCLTLAVGLRCRSVYAARLWYACGLSSVRLWHACGTPVVRLWCACDPPPVVALSLKAAFEAALTRLCYVVLYDAGACVRERGISVIISLSPPRLVFTGWLYSL